MDELGEAINSALELLDAFMSDQENSPDSTSVTAEVLHRFASRASDLAAMLVGPSEWARAVLDDEEKFHSAPTPLIATDAMGFITRVNPMAVTHSETAASDMVGLHVGEFIHADDYDNVAEIWGRMNVDTCFDSAIVELRVLRPRGAKWYRAAIRTVRNDDQTLANLIVQLTDIGDKHDNYDPSDAMSRKFGNLLDKFPTPIIRLSADQSILFSNPAAHRFQQSDRENGWPEVIKEDVSRYQLELARSWESVESSTIDLALITPRGLRYCEATFIPEIGPSGRTETILVIWRDQTNRRRHEQLLAHQARHDPLTGLPNRAHFAELLDQAINRQRAARELGQRRPLAVLFLDLDRFKFVNDSLGHLAGDELLQSVSNRLANAIRPGDVIGRLGGDEFTILAEDIDEVDAETMAARIQKHLKEPFVLTDREFRISASIGIATSETPQDTSDLMRWADSAMYRAKSLGRDRVMTFNQTFSPEVVDQLDFDQAIRSAVENDELTLVYQPEVILASRRVSGVEALVRWDHPTRGLLGADTFIPIAEDNGMIVPIGTWVLRTACDQTMKWHSMGILPDDFVLHVNISTRQLAQTDLVPLVAETLRETAMPPSMLCLEITETGLMHEVDHGLEVLRRLDGLGISLAIDDFGTGYSSLSALRTFPIDMLKIDMSFVSGITTRKNDAAIAKTILTLAHTLGLTPTAEGIETDEQCSMLARMGCPRGQGYLFSPPVSAENAEDLIRRSVLTPHQVTVP